MTIEEIRNTAKMDKYITEKKKQIIDQNKKIGSKKICSICDGNLMYGRMGGDTRSVKKKNMKRFPLLSSWYSENESSNEKQCFLAEYEPAHWHNG